MGGGMQPQGSVFDTSASAYNSGVGGMQATMSPFATQQSMNQYLNPYQNQVIDSSVNRMVDQRNLDLNNVQAQAAQANAFGGARHGLVEANVMDMYNRNIGEMVGGLSSQGFNTAAQLGQGRIGQYMQASQGLNNASQTGFGMGQQLLQGQQQAGMQQMGLMQQILSQAAQQYDQYANYPNQALATALAGVQGNPMQSAVTQTQTTTPGLFDYLSLGAGLGSSYLMGGA